jgi:hypothetical protein
VIICLSVEEYSIEPHVIIFLSVEEELNRTSCDNRFYWVLPQQRDKLSHEVLLSTSSTERQIITWGSIEYFLNWEKNYHITRFYLLPQWRDKLSHEVLLSRKYSIEPHVIIFLLVEEVLNRTSWCDYLSLSWGILNRTSCDSFSLSWGSTQSNLMW